MLSRKKSLTLLAVLAFSASMTASAIDACWVCNKAYQSCLRTGTAQTTCWAQFHACVQQNSPGASCGS